MIRMTQRPDGGVDYTGSISAEQLAALGEEDLELVLHRASVLVEVLALLRGGPWAPAGKKQSEPDATNWMLILRDLNGLGNHTAAVFDAAVREQAATGGSLSQLAWALSVQRWGAQRVREKVAGTRSYPLDPAEPELWARTGVRPPGFED